MAYSSEIEKLERRWAENPRGRNFAPLADAYRKAGEVDKAVELCLSGLERHPDYVSAHIVYGRCLIDQKNGPGAEEVFKKILTLDPENIIALKVLADLADRAGRYDDQVDWLTRLLSADPMNDEARDVLREARTKATAAKPAEEEPALIDLEVAPPPVVEPPIAESAVVEHEEVELKTGEPRHSAIETFDDLSFSAPPSAPAPGLVPEEGAAISPEAVHIDGLARTQYEGSGMFRLDAPEESGMEGSGANEMSPAIDLPLIMPDDLPGRRSSAATPASRASDAMPAAVTLSDDDGAADAATLQAAEPVVTETMADLYLQQGHREDALRVYRALLAERPGDKRLAARIRELEGPQAKRASPPLESATAFLRRVWRGEPTPATPVSVPAAARGALAAAFAGGDDGVEGPGAPTQASQDVISLDAVFGDQVGRGGAELPSPAPPAGPEPAKNASGGFSFDDFFGATPSAGGGATPGRASRGGGRPSRPQPEDEDLDQFQAWLKGLKA